MTKFVDTKLNIRRKDICIMCDVYVWCPSSGKKKV